MTSLIRKNFSFFTRNVTYTLLHIESSSFSLFSSLRILSQLVHSQCVELAGGSSFNRSTISLIFLENSARSIRRLWNLETNWISSSRCCVGLVAGWLPSDTITLCIRERDFIGGSWCQITWNFQGWFGYCDRLRCRGFSKRSSSVVRNMCGKVRDVVRNISSSNHNLSVFTFPFNFD